MQAIDGRGGDGGIDIDVHETATGKLLKVYQLKFFPEGFSGGHSPRKKQIRKSFEQAAKLHPPVWALVIPRNYTTNERKWVTTLLKDSGIRAEFVGRTELDDFQASDPDVIALAERTADRKALAIVGRESAALINMDDVAKEVRRLAARSDTISPNWAFETTVRGGSATRTLFAKHPDAATREPLALNFTANFTNHPDLRREYEDSMKFGLIRPITLPPEVVESFERVGPEWFAARFGASTLELHPAPSNRTDLPATLRVTPRAGSTRVLRGIATWMARGSEGALVETVFSGGLTITWRLSKDRTEGASSTMSFSPQGHTGTDVDRAVRALSALYDDAEVALEIDGRKERLTVAPDSEFGVAVELAELAEDLAVIEQNTGTQFAFPVDMGAKDRIWVRVVRKLLEGEVVLSPDLESLSFTLNGELGESIEQLLTTPSAMVATTSPWSWEVLGEHVTVADLTIYHPMIRVIDAEEHLEALRAGVGRGRAVTAVPGNEAFGFRMYSPSRLRGDKIVAKPWGVTGINEHPEFESGEEIEEVVTS